MTPGSMLLLWTHRSDFGTQDPLFHRDVGFFVFSLPLYREVAQLAARDDRAERASRRWPRTRPPARSGRAGGRAATPRGTRPPARARGGAARRPRLAVPARAVRARAAARPGGARRVLQRRARPPAGAARPLRPRARRRGRCACTRARDACRSSRSQGSRWRRCSRSRRRATCRRRSNGSPSSRRRSRASDRTSQQGIEFTRRAYGLDRIAVRELRPPAGAHAARTSRRSSARSTTCRCGTRT